MSSTIINVDQAGPDFNPCCDEDGNLITTHGDDETEVTDPQAELTDPLPAPITIDREDDQRGVQNTGNEAYSHFPHEEYFMAWPAAADLGGVTIASSYDFNKNRITARLHLLHPAAQRGAAVLEIRAPRDMEAADNPAKQVAHLICIKIPAFRVEKMTFDQMPRDEVNEHFTQFLNPQYPDSTRVGTMEILASQVIVQGVVVPKLLTPEIGIQVHLIIRRALTASTANPLLLRTMLRIGDGDLARDEFCAFTQSMENEKKYDPISPWFAGAPRTQVLNVGNITKILERPDIPMQRAETVYVDEKEYQMHHVYSAVYENDFRKLAVTGYEDTEFTAKMISMTSSVCEAYGLPTAYLCFVDLNNLGVQVPEIGNRLKVTLNVPQPCHQTWTDPNASTLAGPHTNENLLIAPQLQLEAGEQQQPYANDGEDHFLDDNADAQDDYFDGREDDLADRDNRNLWNGTVVECILTSPGHLCCLLERYREPNWAGPANDRPFVLIDIPCTSDRFTTLLALEKGLDKAPEVSVALEPNHSSQLFKDEVRACDTLFSSKSASQIALREYVLCPTVEDAEPVNLLAHMGPLDTTKNFSPSQTKFYDSLGEIKKGISIVNAPFGTGKTTMALAIMLKM